MPKSKNQPPPPIAQPKGANPIPVAAWGLGLLALLGACGASGMLVADRLGWLGEGLPGCGPNSGCAKATASALGKLPFTVPGVGPTLEQGWPVSFLGLAFFISMLAAWVIVGRRVPSSVVHMARLGVLASGFYLVMMLTNMNQYLCKYCLASHACNLVFWLAAEIGTRAGSRRSPGFLKAVVTAGTVFFASSAAMGVLDARAQEQKAAKQEDSLAAEIAAMQAEAAAQQSAPKPAEPAPSTSIRQKDFPPISLDVPVPGDDTLKQEGFTGRYRLGPAEAPIRVVVFSDYQCKDCKRVEAELKQVVKDMPNVSVSHKQFAFDKTCNKYFDTLMHPNACWAARAAEAAGMLRGNAGFWQFHFWLFDRQTNGDDTPGSFTNEELVAGLKSMNYNPDEFIKVMSGPETLALVHKDIDEAVTYGIFSTPMVFVNGREFKAWQAPNAVRRYIEAVAATNPQPASATVDRPMGALDKAVEDWRGWPKQNLDRGMPMFPSGPANAKLRVTLFGDFSEQFTPLLWEAIQKEVKGRSDVSITFLPRMARETCNVMNQPPEKVPGCRMARALESAGRLGGQVAYWKMFDWLMANGRQYNESRLPEAAAAAGLDLETLKTDMDLDEVMFILVANGKVFQRSGARGVPTVFINERCVLRWKVNETPIIDRIVKMAEQMN